MSLQFDARGAESVALHHAEVAACGADRIQAADPPAAEFVPGRVVGGVRQTFARLDVWLARFGADVLFTVTVHRLRRCPLRKLTVCREEHHRQVSTDGVRRLAERHGADVRRIEPERIGARSWTAAIDRFGTCE